MLLIRDTTRFVYLYKYNSQGSGVVEGRTRGSLGNARDSSYNKLWGSTHGIGSFKSPLGVPVRNPRES